MIGSFLVGLLAAVTLERVMVSANLRAAILIGNTIAAIANIAAQIVLGLAAVWAGYTVALKF